MEKEATLIPYTISHVKYGLKPDRFEEEKFKLIEIKNDQNKIYIINSDPKIDEPIVQTFFIQLLRSPFNESSFPLYISKEKVQKWIETKRHKSFYMNIAQKGTKNPTYQYSSLEECTIEATRLAKKLHQNIHIAKIIKSIQVVETRKIDIVEVLHTDDHKDDELPF